MARKVFFSVLGAGFYGECVYGKKSYNGEEIDFESSKTRFVQQATLELLGAKGWQETDAAYILTTKKARSENWDETITQRRNPGTKQIEDYVGLHKILKDMNLPFKEVRSIDIPNGDNEKEIWDIFSILTSNDAAKKIIQEDDELYFDLTHGFRYLPMLVLVLGNYAKFLKHVKVCSITYGNYESRDRQTNIAPIIDLLPLSALQDWTFATADFLENGNPNCLQSLSNKSLRPIIKEEETREEGWNLKRMTDGIKKVVDERKMCRGIDVISSASVVQVINQLVKIQQDKTVLPVLMPILDKLKSSFDPFSKEQNVANTIAAARWCYDNQQYQAAITFLEEGIMSFLCEEFHFNVLDEGKRGLFPSASAYVIGKKQKKDIKLAIKEEDKSLMIDILQHPLFVDEGFSSLFQSIIQLRNDYNHCGMRKAPLAPDRIIKNIKKYIEKTEKYLSVDKITVSAEQLAPKPFINFSNHPSEIWGRGQREAALQYGEIEDLPFPDVKPDASYEDVQQLAEDYVRMIVEGRQPDALTVHVMGEMTFTYAVVSWLKDLGVRCVASTTERRVETTADGKTVSEFRFVGFRDY